MFGSFFQAEIMKRNKKIPAKKVQYQPFHIPVEEINSEKPITQRITQQCQKLKCKFEFLKQEIARENSKKRTKFSQNFVSPIKTSDFMKRNCMDRFSKLNCKTQKNPSERVQINLNNIIKAKNGIINSNSVRCMLKAIRKQKSMQNKLTHIY